MLPGSHIVITRPIDQAAALADELRTRGAIPLLYPGLTYGPSGEADALDDVLMNLANGHYEIVVLTSGQAGRVIGERAALLGLSFAQQSIWTVGAQTAAACQFEAKITTPPQANDAVTLLAALPDLYGKHILLAQSPIAAPTMYNGLVARGADVTVIHPYRVIAGQGGDDVPDALRQGRIAAFTFFSGSAVEGVVARLEDAGISLPEIRRIPAVCFGGSTAAVARALGFNVHEGDTTYETFYRLLEGVC